MTTIGVGDSPTIVRLRAAEPVDAHAMIDDLVATLTPRFQVVRRLGQGGMGTVYLGWDPLLRRNVAIKVLTPEFAADPSAKARFIREAQAAAAVAHRNVVNIFQVGELQQTGAPYFVMQFIDGQTLDAAFPRGKPAAQSPAKRIIGEVAAALAAAHARGLV
ncbi:MAG TPA: protein kinase, partial [Gemmatimonadaceae bacterium]